MRVFAAFTMVVLGAACDSGAPPASSPPPPKPVPPADARTAETPPVDADLSYPKDWIMTAFYENQRHSCQELVYKRGCRAIRTGTVSLDVLLDEHGRVMSVRTRSTDISLEPHVVEKCLLREVPKWKFHPPEHFARELVVSVMFADKC